MRWASARGSQLRRCSCEAHRVRHSFSLCLHALRRSLADAYLRAVVVTASRCVGVGFGCVLGMFPLLLGSHDAVLAAEAAATLAAAANSVR